MDPILLIVLAVIAIVIVAVVLMYNGLVRQRLRVDESWAQIEVQLKRRHDLIPNLVSAVKTFFSKPI
jgi:LemA protein